MVLHTIEYEYEQFVVHRSVSRPAVAFPIIVLKQQKCVHIPSGICQVECMYLVCFVSLLGEKRNFEQFIFFIFEVLNG